MVWYSYLEEFSTVVIHTVKGFGVDNKAEVDVFLEISCFFDDPMNVGSLISGSPAFSNLSYFIEGDYTTLMAESEELKSLLMKTKEKSEKIGL